MDPGVVRVCSTSVSNAFDILGKSIKSRDRIRICIVAGIDGEIVATSHANTLASILFDRCDAEQNSVLGDTTANSTNSIVDRSIDITTIPNCSI